MYSHSKPRYIDLYPEHEDKITPTFETIKYGELIEYHSGNGGYHTGVKVHFFNKKGVFIGNYYEWVPYDLLRFREARNRERVFYGQKFEKPKQFIYENLCNVTTYLIRLTQYISANGRFSRKSKLK